MTVTKAMEETQLQRFCCDLSAVFLTPTSLLLLRLRAPVSCVVVFGNLLSKYIHRDAVVWRHGLKIDRVTQLFGCAESCRRLVSGEEGGRLLRLRCMSPRISASCADFVRGFRSLYLQVCSFLVLEERVMALNVRYLLWSRTTPAFASSCLSPFSDFPH